MELKSRPSPCTSGPFCFSSTDERTEPAGGAGDFAVDAGTTARPARGIAGADGTGNRAAKQSVHTFRRRTPAPRNRAFPDPATLVYFARRAVFRNRPAQSEGFARDYQQLKPLVNWRSDYRP